MYLNAFSVSIPVQSFNIVEITTIIMKRDMVALLQNQESIHIFRISKKLIEFY